MQDTIPTCSLAKIVRVAKVNGLCSVRSDLGASPTRAEREGAAQDSCRDKYAGTAGTKCAACLFASLCLVYEMCVTKYNGV